MLRDLIRFKSSHVTCVFGESVEDIIAINGIFEMLGSSLVSDRLFHILFWKWNVE